MSVARSRKIASCVAVCAGLAACGGGEVSGVLSGMASDRSVTLLNNGADSLTLTRNGRFAFADLLQAGDAYAVTVQTQPAGQVCTVSNGSGKIDENGDSVDDVRVNCEFSASLRGTVSGLVDGTVLRLASDDATLVVTANGAFAFPGTLADGAAYEVRIQSQPFGATCTLTGGTGTFFAATFTDIEIVCG